MTTEELKKKIDGLFFGLHSTNPGDINAVKDILQAALFGKLVEQRGGEDAAMYKEILMATQDGTALALAVYTNDDVARIIRYGETDDGTPLVSYKGRNTIVDMVLNYSVTQYEGYEAIQNVVENWATLPGLAFDGDYYLYDDESSTYITCEGKALYVTIADGQIQNIEKTEVAKEGSDISWEDAQKLIGLPIDEL